MRITTTNKTHDEVECADSLRLSEEQFYALYDWCINPVLSLRDLFVRLREELDRCTRLQVSWQRQECKINIYLFACAIACTVDDYLALPPKSLDFISERYPELTILVAISQIIINSAHSFRGLLLHHQILVWREKWDGYLNQICETLVSQDEISAERKNSLQKALQHLMQAGLPRKLLMRRMILPEGFSGMDLAHHDLFEMARQAAADKKKNCRFLIIGVRTFGAYFAPLVKAHLSALGWPPAFCIAIRPKLGISRNERRKLRRYLSQTDEVLIVDDSYDTGRTLNKLMKILKPLGLNPSQACFVTAGHYVEPSSIFASEINNTGIKHCTLPPERIYKEYFTRSPALLSLFHEYFTGQGWQDVALQKNTEVDQINDQLREHYYDGFHVRMKKVFDIKLVGKDKNRVKRIVAKSVGWGWLGYHAYLTGTRLSDFVPRIIGLRNGLLFAEWLDNIHETKAKEVDGDFFKRLTSYVIGRKNSLHLLEDPWFEHPYYRSTGWSVFLRKFRSIYSRFVVYAAMPLLQKKLNKYCSPAPTLVDGNMRPEDWIQTASGIYKVDFEHHNFGGPELDMVDPAFDLASAIFEFRMSQQEEQELLQTYIQESSDPGVSTRIMVHKLIYGLNALETSEYWVARASSDQQRGEWEKRYQWARKFLSFNMNRCCAEIIVNTKTSKQSNPYFFLDIDEVLDTEILGFPHTTYSGLTALRLLQSRGFSIILNTARSVEDVVEYCRAYDLPGGIGEYGSVLVDKERNMELPLIDTETAEQLMRCREELKKMPGVLLDDSNRYSIRAYRYGGLFPASLGIAEIEHVQMGLQLDRLTFLDRGNDTYILQKETDKGSGISAAKRYFGHTEEQVFAMGDSKHDIAMLKKADIAYAPSNCDRWVRDLSGKDGLNIMLQPTQRGFLTAVRDIIRNRPPEQHCRPRTAQDGNPVLLLFQLTELPPLRQLMATVRWSINKRNNP